ncbi:hypothetical protein RvY_03990 [Ramazzottius varieornatus]|uniref:Inhibitor of growth protein n=1 Tax=Ramazzottius varieornatus TaxID=947166 RepID=A0A1D1UQS1_RAMVA|nr:hypothetical protein RvY_03990 [Ramazzottius varieornatus]
MSLMYLEDYLELVSFLPQEYRERLTKVRELDLEANNLRDNIEKSKKKIQKGSSTRYIASDIKIDVALTTDGMSAADRAAITAEITAAHDRIVQLSVEKVRIVAGLEDLMLRYNRRLQVDTEKFKLELEADNPGITESLEARAEAEMRNLQDSTVPQKTSLPEVRMPSSRRIADLGSYMALQRHKQAQLQGQGHFPAKPIHPSSHERKISTILSQHGHSGVLARAATQAIAQTQQMAHGRRTASLKASYEAAVRRSPNISRDQSGECHAASPATHGVQTERGTSAYRKRQVQRRAEAEEADDGAYDEDKALYCICRQPSHGFMVACDNKTCAIEWFHGACVSVTAVEVEGKTWFCPECRRERERKRAALNNQHLKPDFHPHPYTSSSQQQQRTLTKKYRKPQ